MLLSGYFLGRNDGQNRFSHPSQRAFEGLRHLLSSVLINEAAVAIVTSLSVSTLSKRRKREEPPPATKYSPVRYRVGDVQDYNNTVEAENTAKAELKRLTKNPNSKVRNPPSNRKPTTPSLLKPGASPLEARRAALASLGFAQFIADGQADDTWPFAIVGNKPVDFMTSLSMELPEGTDYEYLTLADYLHRRRVQALDEDFRAEPRG